MSICRSLTLGILIAFIFSTAKAEMGYRGFIEGRYAPRIVDDKNEPDEALQELRAQISLDNNYELFSWTAKVDFLHDPTIDNHTVDLDKGEGWIDLRELSVSLNPTDDTELKIGRQINSWGTGDLVFLNDLFPKDYHYFLGRHVEYIRVPSDTVNFSIFSDFLNFSLVYAPRFDTDRFVDGQKMSYVNPFNSQRAGRNALVAPDRPEKMFRDDEFHLRIYKNISGYNISFYFYDGFFKSPLGLNDNLTNATFPKLSVWGASFRGEALSGIVSSEIALFDSKQDRDGKNPFLPNSEWRLNLAYERELVKNWFTSFQSYNVFVTDYENLRANLPTGAVDSSELMNALSIRISTNFINEKLKASVYNYYSLRHQDFYSRFDMTFSQDDHLTYEFGWNIMQGDPDTGWGLLRDNSNVFTAIRYSY